MSVYLLAVDTTSDFGSIALADAEIPGQIIEELAVDSAGGYAHVLFDEIARMLARHGLSLADMACFATAAGPGSFTGVRVGLTAVMGLAEANRRKVVAVSNLQALASFGSRPLRAPVFDARRGEIYGAVYDANLRVVHEEIVMPLDAWVTNLSMLPPAELEIITSGLTLPPQLFPVIEAPRVLAGAIARIAARDFLAGLAKDPSEIDANYVRRSDAELFWRDPKTVDTAR